MKKLVLVWLLASGFSATAGAVDSDYVAATEKWRQESAQRLAGDYGALSAIGLYWLRSGDNRIGSDPVADIVLPADVAPSRLGVIKLRGKQVSVETQADVPLLLAGKPLAKGAWRADATGKTPSAAVGRVQLELLEREQGYAIRAYDPESPLRRDFAGQQWYPVSADWVVDGRFIPFATPKKLEFDIAIGGTRSALSPGVVVFSRDGNEYRLEVQESRAHEYVAFFFDATTGKETYGGGRVVPISRIAGDRVSLDFNRAYNMPCAVSPYFGCEIAPRQNHLSLSIAAGEKKPLATVQRVASAPAYLK